MHHQIQLEDSQQAYNNPGDRSLETHTHMILSLAHVSVDEVRRLFDLWGAALSVELNPVLDCILQEDAHRHRLLKSALPAGDLESA